MTLNPEPFIPMALNSQPNLQDVEKILFVGQSVTAQRALDGDGWTVAGWEQGLPVSCKPITVEYLLDLCSRYGTEFIYAR